jgi:hypothetical protein
MKHLATAALWLASSAALAQASAAASRFGRRAYETTW